MRDTAWYRATKDDLRQEAEEKRAETEYAYLWWCAERRLDPEDTQSAVTYEQWFTENMTASNK